MELVCDYASSDDEEGDFHQKHIADDVPKGTNVIAAAAPDKREGAKSFEKEPGTKATKKKGIIFSALPIEIQNALTRGISSQDSDSDDDATTKSLHISSKTLKNSELISILPPPKLGMVDAPTGGGKQTSQSSSFPVGGSRLPDHGKLSQPNEVEEVNSEDEDVKAEEIESDDEKDASGASTTNTYFSLPESRTSAASVDAPLKPQLMSSSVNLAPIVSAPVSEPLRPKFAPVSQLLGINTAPDVKKPFVATSSASIYPSPSSSYPYGGSAASAGVYPMSSSTTSNAAYTSTDAHSASSYTETASVTGASAAGNKRRRERDLEQELLSGNLDAVESIGVVREMTVTNDWNSAMYTAAQKSQADIQSQFKISGSASTMEPSRTQSRKHQITSLAAQAAKMEMALMEAKGSRLKTKAETKSKYGW